jgi:acyl dehydratase
MHLPRPLPELHVEITVRDAAEWSEVLDDRNPLHADPDAAVAHGLGRGIVSPGPANMAHLMTLLLRSFPGCCIEAFEARFVAAVRAPTTAVATGVVESEETIPTGSRLHCSLELRAAGRVAIIARAQLRIGPTEVAG